jgi:tetratricopeptide (TPR) repeat protein
MVRMDMPDTSQAQPAIAARWARRKLLLGICGAVVAVAAGTLWWLREVRITRFNTECTVLSAREDWPRLEAKARQWTQWQSAPLAWYWLGVSLKQQREFAAAKEAFCRVPRDGPRGVDAAIEQVEIEYHIEQNPLKALALAKSLLERDPNLASPRRHLIHFYAMTFQRVELIRQVHLAIDHHTDLPEHFVYLFVLEDLSFRDGAEITGRWAQAAPESHFLKLVHEMHRVREARDEARLTPTPELHENFVTTRKQVLAAFDPLQPDPLYLDIQLLLAMDENDIDGAAKLLSLVPESAAADPVFWRYRGWYATQTGNLESACDSYNVALGLYPLAWRTRSEYATALRLRGQITEAGKQGAISGLASDLHADMRRMSHAKSVSTPMLSQIARLAKESGDWTIANAIIRRRQVAEAAQSTPP